MWLATSQLLPPGDIERNILGGVSESTYSIQTRFLSMDFEGIAEPMLKWFRAALAFFLIGWLFRLVTAMSALQAAGMHTQPAP